MRMRLPMPLRSHIDEAPRRQGHAHAQAHVDRVVSTLVRRYARDMRVTFTVVAVAAVVACSLAASCTPPDAKAAAGPGAPAPSGMPAPKGEVVIETPTGKQRFTCEL